MTYVHPSWSCHLNNLALSFYLCLNNRMVHHSKDVISRFTRKMKIIRECQSRLWISVCGATFVGFSMTWHKCCLHGWLAGWLDGWLTEWLTDLDLLQMFILQTPKDFDTKSVNNLCLNIRWLSKLYSPLPKESLNVPFCVRATEYLRYPNYSIHE